MSSTSISEALTAPAATSATVMAQAFTVADARDAWDEAVKKARPIRVAFIGVSLGCLAVTVAAFFGVVAAGPATGFMMALPFLASGPGLVHRRLLRSALRKRGAPAAVVGLAEVTVSAGYLDKGQGPQRRFSAAEFATLADAAERGLPPAEAVKQLTA